MSSEEEPVAWLRAAILARKAAAEAATAGPWEFEGDDPTDDELYSVHDGIVDLVGVTVAFTRDRNVANGQHMALNDPQDTIARCEAELAILDEHRLVLADRGDSHTAHPEYRVARDNPTAEQVAMANGMQWDKDCRACCRRYPCRTVRLLAGGYRHRPGFPAAFAT